jgi:hypothetical protein
MEMSEEQTTQTTLPMETPTEPPRPGRYVAVREDPTGLIPLGRYATLKDAASAIRACGEDARTYYIMRLLATYAPRTVTRQTWGKVRP